MLGVAAPACGYLPPWRRLTCTPGHFFALNLKSQSLFPLALADQVGRKKEHDLRMLKRQSVARLRQGAKKGRKALWVWDKAVVDLPLWQDRKGQGIYFLSQRK